MKNNCWYSLNIDFSNALRKDWEWNISSLEKEYIQCVNTEMFNPDWLNYMASIGVPIEYAMLFYRKPITNSNAAHVDVNGNKKPITYVPCGINWIIEGQDSEMSWYNLPEQYPDIKYTMANTPYINWPVSELEEIDTANMQNSFTLVRTDVPHNVTVNEKPRWAISVRSHVFTTWENAVNHFRSKNLLIER